MAVVALCLLIICALMAGLTLAVSAVDMVWLNTTIATTEGSLQ